MKLAFIALSALSFIAVSSAAHAAGCKQSCTQAVKRCVAMSPYGGTGCDGDLANCKKTGDLHMPSGRVLKNLCKK
jgi:hypothetical protein